MEKEIKDFVDESIKNLGLKIVLDKTLKMREESISIKNKILKSGGELLNIPSHIEMADEIIDYIGVLFRKEREEKIKKILSESRIYSFSEFSKLF